jgi:hypothetical protein
VLTYFSKANSVWDQGFLQRNPNVIHHLDSGHLGNSQDSKGGEDAIRVPLQVTSAENVGKDVNPTNVKQLGYQPIYLIN